MTELKPCPFCGATPQHGLKKPRYCQLHGDPLQDYRVWCPSGCASHERGGKEQAFAAWNTRPARLTAEDREALIEGAETLEADAPRRHPDVAETMMRQAARLRALAQEGGAR